MEILASMLFVMKLCVWAIAGIAGFAATVRGAQVIFDLVPKQDVSDLLRHKYCIGKTGTGKSTMCKNDIINVISQGYGALYIDVHGKDCLELLDAIPPEHIDRVIYIDPQNDDYVIGFPLYDGDNYELAVDALISVFDTIWPGFIGPSTEDLLRMASLAVFPNKGNLLDIYMMLVDENYRNNIKIRDDEVRTFWEDTFPAMIKKDKSRLTPPTNKLRKLIMSRVCRLTLCQSAPKFDLMKAMDENKIIVCNFSKGHLGHDTSRLLAALMVCKLQLCTFRRSYKATPFFCFLDEFQNYCTTSFEEILSESRKYAVSLNLYHQYVAQMPPFLRHAIIGNVGSMFAFRVSEDSKMVADLFGVEKEDISNLPNYYCYARKLVKGVETRAEEIHCDPDPPEYGLRNTAISNSRTYGCRPDEIYAEIRSRTKSEDVMEDEIE